MLTSLITILGILLGFSLTIFVHELGHFLMARRAGVKVEVFSIGIGPRMWKIFTDRHGTEYILAWLPLGGYVKMKGQEDLPGAKAEGAGSDSYLAKTPLQKLSIISAGVVMNVIFAYILLVIAFSIGVPFASNKIAGVQQGFHASGAGFLPGDEITKIGNRNIESWEDILTSQAFLEAGKPVTVQVLRQGKPLLFETKAQQEEMGSGADKITLPDLGFIPERLARVAKLDPNGLPYRSGLREGMDILGVEIDGEGRRFTSMEGIERAIQTHPGSKARLLVTADAETSDRVHEINLTIPTESVPDKGFYLTAVVDVIPGAAADKAGIQNGDQILKINGMPVRGYEDIIHYFQRVKNDQPVTMLIRHWNEELTVSVKPRYFLAGERFAIGVRPSQKKETLAQTVHVTENWMESLAGGIKKGDQVLSAKDLQDKVEYKILRAGKPQTVVIPKGSLQKKQVGFLCQFTLKEKKIRYPIQESLWKSFPRVKAELEETYLFLGRLISGKMSMDMVGGPIRIFEVSYIIGTVKGIGYFLLLFAKIGIGLAVINFLPFPVLDGGHAVFLVYEMIFRKPPPEIVVRVLHYLGFIALMLFFAFVMTNDLRSIFSRWF